MVKEVQSTNVLSKTALVESPYTMGKCYFVVDVEGDARVLSAANMRTSWRVWSRRESR
jgi:hypothetical protein